MSHSSEGGLGSNAREQTTATSSGSYKRYPVSELLRLRTELPYVLLNLDNLSANAETSTILNLPQEAKVNRSFSIRTSALARMQSRPTLGMRGGNSFMRHGGSGSLGIGEQEILYKGHPSRGDKEAPPPWRSHRDASDRSSQPVPSPSAPLVQQDENFKNFIKAVTSPPNVRVTAGGRVVPNTRVQQGPPPRGPIFISPEGPKNPYYQQGVPLARADLHSQGIYMPGSSNYFGALKSAQVSGDTLDSNTSEETSQPAATGETSKKSPPATAHPGIQISPAENFDFTKPYWFADRVLVPQGYPDAPAPALPMNFQGNPGMMHPMYGYMPGVMAGPGGQPVYYSAPNHPLGGMLPPSQPLQYPSIPSMMYTGQQPLGNIVNGTPANQAPHVGPQFGIQGPQMVGFQETPSQRLARLRDELRKIENDIQNNSHQIHVASKLQQRSNCLIEIQRLEAVLCLEMSSRNYRAPSFAKVSDDPARKSSFSMVNESAMNDNIRKPVVVDSSSTASNSVPFPADKGVQAKTSSPEQETTEVVPDQESQVKASFHDKKRSRDRLAAVAATATFEPRMSSVANNSTDVNAAKAKAREAELAANSAAEARLLAHAIDWSVPPQMHAQVNMTGAPTSFSQVGQPRFRHNTGPVMPPPAIHHPRMYPYMPPQAPAPFRGPADLNVTGVPYLRAQHHMGNGEWSYSRQLTDDELRARYLYWGKAPREVQRGLPKYNGKDFFPPSPAKTMTRSSRSSKEHSGQTHLQAPDPFRDIDYGRTNQGVKEGDNDDGGSPASVNSWGQRSLKHIKSDRALGSTMPRMSPSKRETRSPFTDKVHSGFEEDRSTLASDRQSMDADKRSMAENRAPPSILRSMLKTTARFSNTSSDNKDVSSESLGHSLEGKPWLSRSTATSVALPLSGTITSATARGFLPQYGGTASASLAPPTESPDKLSSMFARFSHADAQEHLTSKADDEDEINVAHFQNRRQASKKASSSRLAAADYLRTVANRDQRENQKNNQSFSGRSGYDASHMGGEGF